MLVSKKKVQNYALCILNHIRKYFFAFLVQEHYLPKKMYEHDRASERSVL